MQLLKNLFRVGWKYKIADIICYMVWSLVSLKQGNVKKNLKNQWKQLILKKPTSLKNLLASKIQKILVISI